MAEIFQGCIFSCCEHVFGGLLNVGGISSCRWFSQPKIAGSSPARVIVPCLGVTNEEISKFQICTHMLGVSPDVYTCTNVSVCVPDTQFVHVLSSAGKACAS